MRIPVKLFVASLFLCLSHGLTAQTVVDLIKANPAYASCNYNTYPDSIKAVSPTTVVTAPAISAAAAGSTSPSRWWPVPTVSTS